MHLTQSIKPYIAATVHWLTAVAGAHAADTGLAAWRSSDQLAWKSTTTSIAIEARHPDLLLLTKPTPSRSGPDAGDLLLFADRAREIVRFRSTDQGATWGEPEPAIITGWPKELEGKHAASPSLVQLDDGRIRMYFGVESAGAPTLPDWVTPPEDPNPEAPMIPPPEPRPRKKLDPNPLFPDAPKSEGEQPVTPGASSTSRGPIHSAISNDGLKFAFEGGARLSLAGAAGPEVIRLLANTASDGDTRRIGPWLMFLTRADSVVLATSKDGLSWSRDETFVWSGVHAPSAIAAIEPKAPDASRLVRLFAVRQDSGGAVSAVFDPATGGLTPDSGQRLPGPGQEPAVVATGSGAYLLIRPQPVADKPSEPTPQPRRPLPAQPPVPPTPPSPKPKTK